MPIAEERLAAVEARMERLADLFTLMVDMRADIRALDHKVDRHFHLVIGLQMTLMLAVVAALLGAYFR